MPNQITARYRPTTHGKCIPAWPYEWEAISAWNFFNPDFLENTRAFYLSPAETALLRQRLLRNGYKPLGASAWDKAKIFRIMKQWQLWVLPLGYFFIQSSFPTAQPAFALYLKATHHSVTKSTSGPPGNQQWVRDDGQSRWFGSDWCS
jgi:hypothetical protein